MYTSGTTGKPKGVMQRCNHWWSAMGSVLNLGLTERRAGIVLFLILILADRLFDAMA